jgi:hypothetical protein
VVETITNVETDPGKEGSGGKSGLSVWGGIISNFYASNDQWKASDEVQ